MGQTDPENDFQSAIGTLDARRRFKIPKPILNALGWTDSGAPTQLMAEIVDEGRLRLWNSKTFRPALNSAEIELREIADEDPDVSAAGRNDTVRALRDRYREVSLRPSDDRVQLPVVLHVILEPRLKVTSLYIELGENCVEVFSHSARIKRLRRHLSETNIG